jgi:molybdopterin/thiamine biosynthesis adenylyltransferase
LIPNLGGSPTSISLSAKNSDVVVQRSFSNKPRVNGAFADFYDKIESYTAIVSGPAIEAFGVSPLTFRIVTDDAKDPIFKFQDTLTSRAEIGELASRLENDVVAIIGLGGTGAYTLDFLAKARVKEIRGFDADNFRVHNAYRSPGRTVEEEFGRPKAAVLQGRYENFRNGLTLHTKFIDETCAAELAGVTFAFVCVDKGSSRARIFDLLMSLGIPFIDVGMGLKKRPAGLSGLIRTTYFPPERAAAIRDLGLAAEVDEPDDIYRANIQIGELNALNAAVAVIKFKQIRDFYVDTLPANHRILNIGELKTYEDVLD